MTLLADALTAAPPDLHAVYAAAVRSSLFTGFLTLSSFLLATKTLLVIQFRKDVYERPEYLAAHRRQRPGEPVFGGLDRLARLLNNNILLALATSAAQFSLGFIDSPFTTVVCIGMAAVTVALTAYSVVRIRENLNTLFAWLNDDADRTLHGPTPTTAVPPKG